MTSEEQRAEPAMVVEWTVKGDFVRVLDRLGTSLALSTLPNLVVLLGAADGKLTFSAVPVARSIGMAAGGDRIAVASDRTITVFANLPKLAAHYPGKPGHYDAFFVPRMMYFTGECAMHDMAFAGQALIGANTKFSCICRIDGNFTFTPLWQPSFISQLRGEDRCHLNGFAHEGGALRYVTALAATDTPNGWRKSPDAGGVLIEAATNRILRDDLCMPHSPRIVGDKLYVLNGGEGELLRVDRQSGESQVVARVPGFAHGLAAQSGILFVGMSQNRASRKANPPPLAQRLPELSAGVVAVEEATGRILGTIEFSSGVTEVYDLQTLPGIRRAGMQNILAADSFIGVETPNMVLWSRREDQDGAHPGEVAGTGMYRVRPLSPPPESSDESSASPD